MPAAMAAMVMADNGAEVIKVEPPAGEWARGETGFHAWNRNKKSVVLDLHLSKDRALARRLAGSADVVIENFRPGLTSRFGIDYRSVELLQPRVIYCSISGFGGAHRTDSIKGYEAIVLARSGSLVGLDEIQGALGRPSTHPIYKLVPAASFAASQLALQGITAALLERNTTGIGRYLSTSVLQGAVSLVMRRDFSTHSSGSLNRSDDTLYRGLKLTFLTVECSDGKWIQMCARQDAHFRNWLRAVDLEWVFDDERYRNAPLGITSITAIDDLEVLIRERMKQRSQAEWMQRFVEDFDVPADPFLTTTQFMSHPQMIENQRVTEVTDAVLGITTQVGPLVISSDTPPPRHAGAPPLGRDQGVISSLGDKDADLAGAPTPERSVDTPSAPRRSGPLAGFTVLELAYYLAGPLSGALLAELGARVIKVEPPEGDPWRRVGLESAHLLHGKESIAVDLKSTGGRQVLRALLSRVDAVVTSFRPSVHARLGFDYETVRSINPRVVFLYAASYGSRGPWSQRAAFHSTPNALSGAGILQAGDQNPPVDDAFPDPIAALVNASAIVMGLLSRERFGGGRYLETTMLASTAYAMSEFLLLAAGLPPARPQDSKQLGPSALRHLYECSVGWLMLCVVQHREWSAMVEVLKRHRWVDSSTFGLALPPVEDDAALRDSLAVILAGRPADDWERDFLAVDVPAVRADATNIEEYLAGHYPLQLQSHPEFGQYWRLPKRVTFPGVAEEPTPPCGVGEQTIALLHELGFGSEEIDQMLSRRDVVSPSTSDGVVSGKD